MRRGRSASWSSRGPSGCSRGASATGCRRRCSRSRTGPAARCRRRRTRSRGRAPCSCWRATRRWSTGRRCRRSSTAHAASGAAATLLTTEHPDPRGYGRIVRDADGDVARIVETKAEGDATPEELAIAEVNASVYAFDAAALHDALGRLGTDNAQGELYLTDTVSILRAATAAAVGAHIAEDWQVVLGVNDRVALAEVRALLQRRILEAHMLSGVTVIDPATTYVDAGVEIGRDAVLEPMTVLRGATRIGAGSRVGPSTTLIDARLGEDVTILNAHVVDAELHDGVTVGPFAYLRPGTVLRAGSKAGTFVELKNSDIGEGTKVPHLSYLGDADVGAGTNIGAGNVTANYDGVRKHRTRIGSGVQDGRGHDVRRAGDGRRQRLDGRRGGRARGRARRRAGGRRARRGHIEGYDARRARPGRLLRGLDSAHAMSTTIVPQPHPSTRLEVGYEKTSCCSPGGPTRCWQRRSPTSSASISVRSR